MFLIAIHNSLRVNLGGYFYVTQSTCAIVYMSVQLKTSIHLQTIQKDQITIELFIFPDFSRGMN